MLQLSKVDRNRVCEGTDLRFLGDQPEELSDEPDLTANIIASHPPNLPLPDHVHRFIALNRSPGSMVFSEALFGLDPAFNRAMVLLDNVVQVLDRSMVTSAPKRPFLLNVRDSRAVNRRQVRIDGPSAADGSRRSGPYERAVWRHRHRGTPTAGSQS